MRLQECFEDFLRDGSTYWAPSSYQYYKRNVDYFFNYLANRYRRPSGSMELSELPETILAEYVVWLRSKEKYAGHPLRGAMNVNGTIKNNTVNTYMCAVKCFFNYLYRRKYTGIRYTEGLKLPRSDDDQIVPLLASEVYRIGWMFDEEKPGDLVFHSNTIVINRSKGNKSRVVLMCPLLEKLLRHTFATSYIMGGGNLETLRLLLGHFDYSVTRKYLHLAAQYQITGTDIYRLDPIFFKKRVLMVSQKIIRARLIGTGLRVRNLFMRYNYVREPKKSPTPRLPISAKSDLLNAPSGTRTLDK